MLFGGILSYLYYVSFSYTLFCWLFWFLFSFPVIIHVHTWFCIYNFYYFPYRNPPMYTSLRAHKTWICCGLRSGTDSPSGDHTRTPVPPALPPSRGWALARPTSTARTTTVTALKPQRPSWAQRAAATGMPQREWVSGALTLLHTPLFSFLMGLDDLTPSLLLLSTIKTKESGIQGPCGSSFILHGKWGFILCFLKWDFKN